MNKHFILAGLAASLANLIMNAGAYFLFLGDIMAANPPVSDEFNRQLVRPADELIGWAMVATTLTMGFFIATVVYWSGARSFVTGLLKGLVFGALFWSSVNFGLYASSNHFSLTGVLADLPCSTLAMAVGAAVAAAVLGRGNRVKSGTRENDQLITSRHGN